jgi:phosphomannomutase
LRYVDDTRVNASASVTVHEAAVIGLLTEAEAWRDADPDPRTRDELTQLLQRARATGPGQAGTAPTHAAPTHTALAEAALAELADRFAGRLQFGTAGLRGALGAGPNRMNRVVVIRAAAGLAAYLRGRVPGTPRVVVGFDARHNSDVFARDTCAVATAAGCEAMVLPRPLPTPVLAFAVRQLGADAGVMVTASHNPPQDNGYKVYLGGRVSPDPGCGVQIVPPADGDISAAIAAAGPVSGIPLADDGWHTLDGGVLDDYLAGACRVVAPDGPRDLDLVTTPLHGVGGETVQKALQRSGFRSAYVVPEQAAPDPEFPTVAFPNPEEPGAIDLALAAADARGADLVIANDPDADRCAVAVPDPALPPGPGGRTGWRMLRGDELGALLGEHVLTRRGREGAPPITPDGTPPVVACSIVSSQLLGRIAAAHGCGHVETLTGFKWIARVQGLVFGYEEALGYCIAPQLVRDKDGISAALLVAELAAELKAAGRTLLDALDDLARTHGVHVTDQLSVRVSDLRLIDDALHRLRSTPPSRLGGGTVTSVDDLSAGEGDLPPTDALRYRTGHGVRVVVRPSGTEPKLKCYLEAVLPPGGDLVADRSRAAATLRIVRGDLSAALGLP